MTNRRVLHALLTMELDLPTFDPEVDAWCFAHGLTVYADEGRGPLSLTTTGKNLLNNTIQHFTSMLQNFHDSGQLNVKDANGTNKENNDDAHEQKRDGGKGKATKGRKKGNSSGEL